jgi:F-type H+-transporting ATPase subunit b
MLSIDISFLVVFFIIWILLAVLTKIFFNPLRKVMNKREEDITLDEIACEQAKQEYAHILNKIEEDIKNARTSSRKTREQLSRDALKEKERMLEEISAECRSQVSQAKKEMEMKLSELKKDLERKSKDLSEEIEKRLLEE